jgi:hypothetical protein
VWDRDINDGRLSPPPLIRSLINDPVHQKVIWQYPILPQALLRQPATTHNNTTATSDNHNRRGALLPPHIRTEPL